MNKLTLTTTLLGAIISSTSHAYTVYSTDESSLIVSGRVEPRFNISDANKTAEDTSFSDISRIRMNIAGSTKVSGDIKVFAYYSGEIYSDSSDSKNRYMYVGVGSRYGAFSYGQQDSAQVILTDVTNIMETFGYSAVNITEGNNEELENNFVYIVQLPMGFSASLNYVRDDEIGNYSTGGSIIYNSPIGLQLGAGYVSGKQQAPGQNREDAFQYSVSAAYTLGPAYFGAIYVKGKVDHVSVNGFELAAAYTINEYIFRYVYNYRTSDFSSPQLSLDYGVNYNALEAVYNVTDDLVSYVGYEFNRLDGAINDNQLQVGARYMF